MVDSLLRYTVCFVRVRLLTSFVNHHKTMQRVGPIFAKPIQTNLRKLISHSFTLFRLQNVIYFVHRVHLLNRVHNSFDIIPVSVILNRFPLVSNKGMHYVNYIRSTDGGYFITAFWWFHFEIEGVHFILNSHQIHTDCQTGKICIDSYCILSKLHIRTI